MAFISFKKIKGNIKKSISLAKTLKQDKRVPHVSKIFLAMAIGYFLSPLDLIPDFIPVIGQLDDLVIVPLLIILAIRMIPREVFLDNYRRIFKK